MSSIKIRSKRQATGIQLRILISHPMTHGVITHSDFFLNEEKPVAIKVLTVTLNQKVIISCELGDGTPKNPFFVFVLKNAQTGDKVTVNWLDSSGQSDSEEHTIT